MRVEAPRLSEQPVLPSFPTVTSLPSKDKERPPHLSGDAKGKGPPMKKRKRFSLAWLALLALASLVLALMVGSVHVPLGDVFPANQLGSDTDLLAQVRSGGVEFFNLSTSILATLVPVSGIVNTGSLASANGIGNIAFNSP